MYQRILGKKTTRAQVRTRAAAFLSFTTLTSFLAPAFWLPLPLTRQWTMNTVKQARTASALCILTAVRTLVLICHFNVFEGYAYYDMYYFEGIFTLFNMNILFLFWDKNGNKQIPHICTWSSFSKCTKFY